MIENNKQDDMTGKQKRVLLGMAVGLLVALATVVLGWQLNPFNFADNPDLADRLALWAGAIAVPATMMFLSIAKLARHRFFTPEDIDGSGLTIGTDKAKVLQSLLQNTLEQSVLAVLVYGTWSMLMPGNSLSVIPLAAGWFFVGRLLFFIGYEKGAPSRALGFTLTFYPSGVMIFVMGIDGLANLLS